MDHWYGPLVWTTGMERLIHHWGTRGHRRVLWRRSAASPLPLPQTLPAAPTPALPQTLPAPASQAALQAVLDDPRCCGFRREAVWSMSNVIQSKQEGLEGAATGELAP